MPETKSKAEGGRDRGRGGEGEGRWKGEGGLGKKGCSILNTFQNINISYLFYSS
jgi:hypothetical protein